ncbi:UDP-galactose transporter [Rhizoctonia solani]|uniref:UDP-galactose transporter n=1 Tax=Rhizoctonia solani TaxID=456999 RepID=A0A8H8T4H0_9AGAM|nr:UDP-galactose transporter [Rhizoctonia solani]QRW27448.1 UDP-galactose transporter [Rhizoctonia solani]
MSTRPIKRATSGAGPSTKRTRFTDPSDSATNGDDQTFAEQVDENLENVSSRKGVKTEGYESDSSDDGEGVVESRKKKGADDDDDDDMFAATDPDKAKENDGAGKKKEKFLALGDIEGQEFGRTATAESSDEDEPEDEDDAERKKKQGMGYEMSSFNMKAEMEEGKFAEDGTFVRSFDPHAAHDKWMEGLDEREMKKAKKSKKLMESREREREQREAKEAERGKEDVMKELLGFMQKGETVLEALQRLGSNSKGPRRGQKKKAATEVLPQSIDGTAADENAPEESPVARVTSLASTLMSLGDSDVYEATYEMMLRLVRRSGIVSADWDPHPPPPQTPDTKYEYRWAPDYVAASGGQASADAVYGPYGVTEMGTWKAALYFGDDAERIQVGVWAITTGVAGAAHSLPEEDASLGPVPRSTVGNSLTLTLRLHLVIFGDLVTSVNLCGSPASPDTDLHRRQPNSLAHQSSNLSLNALYQHNTPPTSSTPPAPSEKNHMNGSPKPAGANGLLPPATITPKEVDTTPRFLGMPLKYVSLVTLAVQNASLTIIMHYSRVSTPANRTYSAASAVLLNELLKGSISLLIALFRLDDQNPKTSRPEVISLMSGAGDLDDDSPTTPMIKAKAQGRNFLGHRSTGSGSIRGVLSSQLRRSTSLLTRLWCKFRRLGREVFSPDCWKLSIPAILYVIQNNLQFVAASNLDVATFQVTYQMKILTTAAFSVMLLRKRLSKAKWAALFFLALGVGIVQIQSTAPKHEAPVSTNDNVDPVVKAAAESVSARAHEVIGQAKHVMNPLKGFAAVSAACITSGLAGVYFEMVLKGSQADLWVRNVQLSLFSLLPALVPIIFNNSGTTSDGRSFPFSLFANFSGWAWATVLTQVFGGLITAIVIKYSDNIMKGFATSLSIVLSFLASVALFDFRITLAFLVGSSTVLAATWMYNQADMKTPNPAKIAVASGTRDLTNHNGPSSTFPPGSPVADDAPILGQTLKKKSSSAFPSPRNIAQVLGFSSSDNLASHIPPVSLTPDDTMGANPYSYSPNLRAGSISGAHTPLNAGSRSGAATPANWSRPPSRASSIRPALNLSVPGSGALTPDNGSGR